MYNEDVLFAAKELRKLIGFKIVDTVITEDKDSYGFVVERADEIEAHVLGRDRKVCWVDCDPEGNGPGWLQIEEHPDEKPTTSG